MDIKILELLEIPQIDDKDMKIISEDLISDSGEILPLDYSSSSSSSSSSSDDDLLILDN